jgi:hypothetical protein
MGHASIENLSPFAFATTFAADEEGRPLMATVIQASYSISPGDLQILNEQLPVNLAGKPWGDPGTSSYKIEPQSAFTKPATDVVLIGHAYNRTLVSGVPVRLRLGPLDKTIRVTGDRYWIKSLGVISMSTPEPFEKVPLIYERAFGGWDRSNPDPDKHAFEPRNPVGTGFRSKLGSFEDGIRLPNLEDPRDPITSYGQIVTPTAFGFTSPDWQPRAKFAGTYDEQWMKNRMPLLPKDFDRRFFNAASPGLIAPGYLKGDEPVRIENASPGGYLSFSLPGVRPPECRVQLVARPDALVKTNLDTVIINTDEDLLMLIWRGFLSVRNGPHDVVSIRIRAEGVSAPVATT